MTFQKKRIIMSMDSKMSYNQKHIRCGLSEPAADVAVGEMFFNVSQNRRPLPALIGFRAGRLK